LGCLKELAQGGGAVNLNCVNDILTLGGLLQAGGSQRADDKGWGEVGGNLDKLGKGMLAIGIPLDYYANYSTDRSEHGAGESALEAGVQTAADQYVSSIVTPPLVAAGAACGEAAEVCVPGGYVAGAYLTVHMDPIVDNSINHVFNGVGRVSNAVNNGVNSAATDVAGPAGPSLVNMALNFIG
jgi:hypothetical protein